MGNENSKKSLEEAGLLIEKKISDIQVNLGKRISKCRFFD